MKQAFVITAIIGLVLSAPQPRKLFSEHVEDFLNLIIQESGSEITELMDHYVEYEEFQAAMDYVRSTNFKDLVYEMEALPEFNAVVDFLENDDIDIHTFIDIFNEIIAQVRMMRKSVRHSTSGTTLSAFIYDSIAVFPKGKLAALFDEKMANDEKFRTAINNLQSEEWNTVFFALWENPTFQKEIVTLRDNGVELEALFEEVMAIFGQN